jgi:hypothetical protein
MNFGQKGNGMFFDCGKHEGAGKYDPLGRAALYAWFRDRCPHQMNAHQRAYLTSYEAAHGAVQYVGTPQGHTQNAAKEKSPPERWYDKM